MSLDSIANLQTMTLSLGTSAALIEQAGEEDIVLACNDAFLVMAGAMTRLPLEGPVPLSSVLPQNVADKFHRELDQVFDTRTPREFEHHFESDGAALWWRVSLHPIGDWQTPRALVTAIDITDSVVIADDKRRHDARFELVVERAHDGIITVNDQGRIVMYNEAAETLFGWKKAEVLGQSIEMLIPAREHGEHSRHLHRFSQSPIRSRKMNPQDQPFGVDKHGREFPIDASISKIVNEGQLEFVAVLRDVEERMRLVDLLTHQATTDFLTGVPNRREFTDVGRNVFEASNGELSVLMLDVDHFKRINDNYGHTVGDQVLAAVGRTGVATMRHRDLFARLGGEEFAALLPDTNAEQAIAVAERLRVIFETGDFDCEAVGDHPIRFTVSIGVASRSSVDQSILDLLKRADIALYRAKAEGRNRVALYVEPPGDTEPRAFPTDLQS